MLSGVWISLQLFSFLEYISLRMQWKLFKSQNNSLLWAMLPFTFVSVYFYSKVCLFKIFALILFLGYVKPLPSLKVKTPWKGRSLLLYFQLTCASHKWLFFIHFWFILLVLMFVFAICVCVCVWTSSIFLFFKKIAYTILTMSIPLNISWRSRLFYGCIELCYKDGSNWFNQSPSDRHGGFYNLLWLQIKLQ